MVYNDKDEKMFNKLRIKYADRIVTHVLSVRDFHHPESSYNVDDIGPFSNKEVRQVIKKGKLDDFLVLYVMMKDGVSYVIDAYIVKDPYHQHISDMLNDLKHSNEV